MSSRYRADHSGAGTAEIRGGDVRSPVATATVFAMNARRASALVALLAATASACSSAVESGAVEAPTDVSSPADDDGESAESLAPTAATETATDDDATTSSTVDSTDASTTSTTTTTVPLDVYDPACVVQVQPGEGLLEIADRFDDDTVDAATIRAENGLTSSGLFVDQLLDVCVDNGLNDIDGSERGRNAAIVSRAVAVQQAKLNELFDGYGIRELSVDGVSGSVTQQRLCAFRLSAGLPISLDDMEPGSAEEERLLSADRLTIPISSAIFEDRWVLIDETCQIMFVGRSDQSLDFVFPTSTGDTENPTRPQDRSEVFKYNPATFNNGWHNSTSFPAAEDNPLNGNMYKPLYFDNGLAIHGANNVPRYPASKGCARLRVPDMNTLIDWLGLSGQRNVTYNNSQINLSVNIQGEYQY